MAVAKERLAQNDEGEELVPIVSGPFPKSLVQALNTAWHKLM